jgi:ketosteroid isomerase-like protein
VAVDATAWLAAYGAAWEARDGDAAAALFADDAEYCWGPFEDALVGGDAIRERWNAATAAHRDVRFSADVLGRDRDRVFVHWSVAVNRVDDASPTELDGAFVLDFAPDGRCSRLQEWWMVRP